MTTNYYLSSFLPVFVFKHDLIPGVELVISKDHRPAAFAEPFHALKKVVHLPLLPRLRTQTEENQLAQLFLNAKAPRNTTLSLFQPHRRTRNAKMNRKARSLVRGRLFSMATRDSTSTAHNYITRVLSATLQEQTVLWFKAFLIPVLTMSKRRLQFSCAFSRALPVWCRRLRPPFFVTWLWNQETGRPSLVLLLPRPTSGVSSCLSKKWLLFSTNCLNKRVL